MSNGKVHILPVMADEPDEPKQGMFAMSFGKGWPERAVWIFRTGEVWTVVLDGRVNSINPDWRLALSNLVNCRTMLLGRPLEKEEYDRIIRARRADILSGARLDQPINHNSAKPPF